MKIKTVLTFLLFLFSCLFQVQKAHADGISLSVSPSLLQIHVVAPAAIQTPVTITNQGNDSVDIAIHLKLFQSSINKNGQIQFLSDTESKNIQDQDIFKKVQLVENGFARQSLSLGPKQVKKLSLHISLPKKEPSADYYFSVIFLATSKTDSQDIKNMSTEQAGIATNVLLAIGSKEPSQGILEEFSAPIYSQSGPIPFIVNVRNTGSHFISPKGVILIKNMFGQTVGRVEIPEANILAGTTRSLYSTTLDLTAKPPSQTISSEEPPKAIWPETFLLGFYSADLSLALSDEGPVINKTIHFAAFPAQVVVIIAFAVLILLFIFFKVKAKLASD